MATKFVEFWLKTISYIYPITLHTTQSNHHETLEIGFQNGKKVLNTATTNYSYGSLQEVLKTGLLHLNLDSKIQNILVLGMGAGSVVQTIRENFQLQMPITLVDIDAKIIELTEQHFNLKKYKNIEIICADAFDFIKQTNQKFDVIIVDIFIENQLPTIFLGEEFIKNLAGKTHQKILFNTLIETLSDEEFIKVRNTFQAKTIKTKVIDNVLETNRLLIIEKI